ncbi:hypothetical protein DMC30DRAFT_390232 [Rhodotorula diobovata]|uniref:Uncharacterized protein n=1 Tax=Rhodotorula diobovata TaxID=5288 RepID=A0A5C5G4F4_9BASI|nr:hypothetical protein DMC30DRAFT_390232 [Rhodotorula diobovata]
MEAQGCEIRRLKRLVHSLSKQVLALGGKLDDDDERSVLGLTLSPRGSVSLEVPSTLDRRDSSASTGSISSGLSTFSVSTPSEELFPPVWPTQYSDFKLAEDDIEVPGPKLVVAQEAEPQAQVAPAVVASFSFPGPAPLPPLATPKLPTFPAVVIGRPVALPDRRHSVLDSPSPSPGDGGWRAGPLPPCASPEALFAAPRLHDAGISPALLVRKSWASEGGRTETL